MIKVIHHDAIKFRVGDIVLGKKGDGRLVVGVVEKCSSSVVEYKWFEGGIWSYRADICQSDQLMKCPKEIFDFVVGQE